jgi:hypothetical protein
LVARHLAEETGVGIAQVDRSAAPEPGSPEQQVGLAGRGTALTVTPRADQEIGVTVAVGVAGLGDTIAGEGRGSLPTKRRGGNSIIGEHLIRLPTACLAGDQVDHAGLLVPGKGGVARPDQEIVVAVGVHVAGRADRPARVVVRGGADPRTGRVLTDRGRAGPGRPAQHQVRLADVVIRCPIVEQRRAQQHIRFQVVIGIAGRRDRVTQLVTRLLAVEVSCCRRT